MEYSPVIRSFNMAAPLNFEPCAPPSEWRLELRFSYLGHVNFANLTHKYSHTKNANRLELSRQLCAIFVDNAYGSLHVSFVELCAYRGVQVYTNSPIFVIKSAIWRL